MIFRFSFSFLILFWQSETCVVQLCHYLTMIIRRHFNLINKLVDFVENNHLNIERFNMKCQSRVLNKKTHNILYISQWIYRFSPVTSKRNLASLAHFKLKEGSNISPNSERGKQFTAQNVTKFNSIKTYDLFTFVSTIPYKTSKSMLTSFKVVFLMKRDLVNLPTLSWVI